MTPSLYLAAFDAHDLALRIGRHHGFFHGVLKLILIFIIVVVVLGVLTGVLVTRAIGRRLRGRDDARSSKPNEADPRWRR